MEAVDPESGLLRWQKELLDLYRALQAEVIVEERSMTRKELHGMARSIMSPPNLPTTCRTCSKWSPTAGVTRLAVIDVQLGQAARKAEGGILEKFESDRSSREVMKL